MIIRVDPDGPVPPYEQVRSQVAAMITAGTLPPGFRLPPIRQLATDLDLAAGTVARAYRELDAAGLVDTRGRRGTTVADPEAWGTTTQAPDVEAALDDAAANYVTLARQLGVASERALEHVRAALAGPTTDVH